VFVTSVAPALTPNGTIEQNSIQEPNVILGPDGLYHMTYSGDCFNTDSQQEAIFLATSSDLAHWTRYGTNPIIGRGFGGAAGTAHMSYQINIGVGRASYWNVYFSDANGNVAYDKSTDGYNYTYGGIAVQGGSTGPFAEYCTNNPALDSMGVVPNGSGYSALCEVYGGGTCSGEPFQGSYVLWNLVSADGHTWAVNSSHPLDSITSSSSSIGAGVLYAGGRSTVYAGSHWHTWPHINYPTKIWHSQSNDLFNWQTDTYPTISYTPNMYGLTSCNQVADASVIQAFGNTFMFFSAVDNTNEASVIGSAEFHGTLAQFDACQNPTPTPTFTPTVTATITPTPSATPPPCQSIRYILWP